MFEIQNNTYSGVPSFGNLFPSYTNLELKEYINNINPRSLSRFYTLCCPLLNTHYTIFFLDIKQRYS